MDDHKPTFMHKELRQAALEGDIEKVRGIILKGEDILKELPQKDEYSNYIPVDEKTDIKKAIYEKAILWAAKGNHLNIVKLLVEAGGRMEEGFHYILIFAQEHDNIPLIKYLVEQTGGNAEAIWWAARKGHGETLKSLLEDPGMDSDKRIKRYTTLLWEDICKEKGEINLQDPQTDLQKEWVYITMDALGGTSSDEIWRKICKGEYND